jgi:hypothetical protein
MVPCWVQLFKLLVVCAAPLCSEQTETGPWIARVGRRVRVYPALCVKAGSRSESIADPFCLILHQASVVAVMHATAVVGTVPITK